jgi:MinD superfamily P-loop ATPase
MPALVEALSVPPDGYTLWRCDQPLAENETLFASGVLRGDVLVLRPPGPGDGGPKAVPAGPDEAVSRRSVRLIDLVSSQIDRPARSRGKVVTFWSGPSGGTGRTTLALSLSLLVAEDLRDVVILALSEPALCAYLPMPRVPDVSAFFETGSLEAAEQIVSWGDREGEGGVLRVVLGPAQPRGWDSAAREIQSLVEAAQTEHDLVIVDLPPLTPSRDVWVTQPLRQTDQLIIVAAPGVTGVVATVEALGVYYDLGAEMKAHVALNRRAPSGLSLGDFVAGVGGIWGFCPPVTEIPFFATLPDLLDRGEMPPVTIPLSGETLIGVDREERRWVAAIEGLVASLFGE